MFDTHALEKGDAAIEFVRHLIRSYKKSLGDSPYKLRKKDFSLQEEWASAVDPLFAAKSSVYFRHEVGMHPAIVLLVVYLSRKVISRSWSKYYFSAIVKTPMDMIHILDTAKSNDYALSNAMKKGFVKAFERFKQNDLASYQNNCGEMTLIDIVNLIHPKHTESIRKLISGELSPIEGLCEESLNSDKLSLLESLSKKNMEQLINEIREINFK